MRIVLFSEEDFSERGFLPSKVFKWKRRGVLLAYKHVCLRNYL